jgi:hypothetical protein
MQVVHHTGSRVAPARREVHGEEFQFQQLLKSGVTDESLPLLAENECLMFQFHRSSISLLLKCCFQ